MSDRELTEQAQAAVEPDLLPERVEPAPLAQANQTPAAILRLAVEKDIDPDAIRKLSELVWKQEDRRAAQEFAAAKTEFFRRCPEIIKSKTANIATRGGGKYSYRYAPIDQIDRTVRPILTALGLSYGWDSVTEGGMMTVICTLRHINGHSETSSFACPTASNNPGMSEPQKAASAHSFAKRQTLTAVLGLTTTEPDTDGVDPTAISAKQIADLECLIEEVHADLPKFLEFMGVPSLSEIVASDYARAVAALKRKGRSS